MNHLDFMRLKTIGQELILFFILLIFFSCTPQKELVYFQEASSTYKADSSLTEKSFALKIYPEDILMVQLFTINPDAMPGISTSIDKQFIDNRSAYEKGYIVDKNGDLNLPLIGSVHLAGLTLLDARDTLVNRFKQFVDDPVVVVKKLSFKITVLGEVNNPGLFYIENEKMTFSEALGLAGDLTQFADRTQLAIFRKLDNGQVQKIPVDLTKTDFLALENKYIQQDDIIYAKGVKRRALSNVSPGLVVITSIISTTAIVITLILEINKE